jgi:hypothetical protein
MVEEDQLMVELTTLICGSVEHRGTSTIKKLRSAFFEGAQGHPKVRPNDFPFEIYGRR